MTEPAYAHLPGRPGPGAVDEATLDASVRRVLEAKLRMGLFDDPYVDEARAAEVLDDPAHREVARVAAERSAVLLRNEGDLLPLDAGSARLGRRHRPARGLPARHPRAVVLRLRPRRDRHRPGRHPGPGRGRRRRAARARRTAAAAAVPLDLRGVRRQRAGRPGGLRRRGRAAGGRRTWPGTPTSPSSWSASGRTRSASRPPARRSSCPAASSSWCRPSSRPAPRSCCWS